MIDIVLKNNSDDIDWIYCLILGFSVVVNICASAYLISLMEISLSLIFSILGIIFGLIGVISLILSILWQRKNRLDNDAFRAEIKKDFKSVENRAIKDEMFDIIVKWRGCKDKKEKMLLISKILLISGIKDNKKMVKRYAPEELGGKGINGGSHEVLPSHTSQDSFENGYDFLKSSLVNYLDEEVFQIGSILGGKAFSAWLYDSDGFPPNLYIDNEDASFLNKINLLFSFEKYV